jgi:hypothetical protein
MFGDNFRDVTLVTTRALDLCRDPGTNACVMRAIYGPTLTYLWHSLVLQHERREEDIQCEEWCPKSSV